LLKWYYYVLLGVVALVALSMTWWSMFDLGVSTLSVPVLIAGATSLLFDLGAVYLGLLSIQYAKTPDSGFGVELGTFSFIAASTYIVAQHGILLNYPVAGIIMFAAAPVVLGIMLKATLNYLNRQQRRESGRITEKLPSVGWLTWVRYLPQTWKLMSVAMQTRLVNAADKLVLSQDRHGIFVAPVSASVGQPETIKDKPQDKIETLSETRDKAPEQLSQAVRPALTSSDKPVLPVWLPNEPTMTLATLSRTCLSNGVTDIETIYRYATIIKGQDVNKASLRKTLDREKIKLS
jgi:hypothetical protein